ncbi:MAG: thioredoxin family protein [Psychroflexus maritimus]
MNKHLFIFCLLISGLGWSQSNQEVFFYSADFERTLSFAEEVNRPIFIDFYAVWCGPCRKMSKEVFTDPKIASFFNANFINKKINVEKGEGIQLAKKFKVKSYPNLVFLNSEGEVILKAKGYKNARQLKRLAIKALKKM